jgi:hypothetical protein
MNRRAVTRIVVRCLVTVGIAATLLLAGGAPSDFTGAPTPTPQVGP